MLKLYTVDIVVPLVNKMVESFISTNHLSAEVGKPYGAFTLPYAEVVTPPDVGMVHPHGTCTVTVVSGAP